MTRVLFLGLGGIGQRHLRNLRALVPDARIAAVRHMGRRFEIGPDLRADQGVDIVAKYGIELFPDIAAAIEGFRPDFAVVASPTSRHVPQTLELLRHRVPVLLEKPAAADEAGLDALLAARAQAGVPVMVAYMLRFHPAVAEFRRLVAERAVGPITAIEVEANSYLPSWHPYEGIGEFYAGRKDLGGGAILTEIHLVDLLAAMVGKPRRLWSLGGTLSPHGLDVEDTVTALLDYEIDGRKVAAALNISFTQRPIRHAITVKGERGRISWNLAEAKVVVEDCEAGSQSVFEAPEFERNAMFVEELRHFLRCLAKGETPEGALDSVADGQRIANAMRRSLAEGAVVEV